MKILITGICGFVGSTLTRALLESTPGLSVTGIDNFIRPGSETNRAPLTKLGVKVLRGDIRFPRDLAKLPAVDWVSGARFVSLPGRMKLSMPVTCNPGVDSSSARVSVLPTKPQMPVMRIFMRV